MNSRTLLGTRSVGLEFIMKACWFCQRNVYSISGVVTTVPDCSTWSKAEWGLGEWALRDFYALFQMDDATVKQIAVARESISRCYDSVLFEGRRVRISTVDKRYVRSALADQWASVCPTCSHHEIPEKMISKERASMLPAWGRNVRDRRLLYRGIELTFGSPCAPYRWNVSGSLKSPLSARLTSSATSLG